MAVGQLVCNKADIPGQWKKERLMISVRRKIKLDPSLTL